MTNYDGYDDDEFYEDDDDNDGSYDDDGSYVDNSDIVRKSTAIHEQIVVEHPVSFSVMRETGPDGKKKFFSLNNTRREVVSTVEFDENQIIEHERKRDPNFSFGNLSVRVPDQFVEQMGTAPSWNDINEDTIKGD